MSAINELHLPTSVVNKMTDKFISTFESIKDLDGNKIFANVARGITLPEENQVPNRQDMPCVRIWSNSIKLIQRSRPFLINEINPFTYDFFFYFYSFSKGDIQKYRDDLFAYIFDKWLTEKTAQTPNGMEREKWYEIIPQEISVDHTNAFKKFDGAISPVKPPMYVTRVEIQVKLYTNIT